MINMYYFSLALLEMMRFVKLFFKRSPLAALLKSEKSVFCFATQYMFQRCYFNFHFDVNSLRISRPKNHLVFSSSKLQMVVISWFFFLFLCKNVSTLHSYLSEKSNFPYLASWRTCFTSYHKTFCVKKQANINTILCNQQKPENFQNYYSE